MCNFCFAVLVPVSQKPRKVAVQFNLQNIAKNPALEIKPERKVLHLKSIQERSTVNLGEPWKCKVAAWENKNCFNASLNKFNEKDLLYFLYHGRGFFATDSIMLINHRRAYKRRSERKKNLIRNFLFWGFNFHNLNLLV